LIMSDALKMVTKKNLVVRPIIQCMYSSTVCSVYECQTSLILCILLCDLNLLNCNYLCIFSDYSQHI